MLHAKGIHPRKSTRRIHMPKRPYLGPAVDEAAKLMPAIFLREWERAV